MGGTDPVPMRIELVNFPRCFVRIQRIPEPPPNDRQQSVHARI